LGCLPLWVKEGVTLTGFTEVKWSVFFRVKNDQIVVSSIIFFELSMKYPVTTTWSFPLNDPVRGRVAPNFSGVVEKRSPIDLVWAFPALSVTVTSSSRRVVVSVLPG